MTNQIKTSTPLPHRRQYHHMDNIEEETRIPLPSPQPFRRSQSMRLRASSSYHNELSSSLTKEDTTDFVSQVKKNNCDNLLCRHNFKIKSTLSSSRSLQSFNTDPSNSCSKESSSQCNGATTSCHNHVVATNSKKSQQQRSPILQSESNHTIGKSPATNRRDHGMVSYE